MRILLPLLLQVAAPPADVAADIRCGAVLGQQLRQGTGIDIPAFLVGMAFFIGRIEGAKPGIDAVAAIEAARTAPGAVAMIDANRERCAAALDAVFRRLEQAPAKNASRTSGA